MRVAMVAFVAIVFGGCRSQVSPGLRLLVGEVHVHGFPGGFHPAAFFVTAGIAADSVDGESIITAPRALHEGDCAARASTDADAPPPPMADAGALRIVGGSGVGRVELRFHDPAGYLAEGTLPRAELFRGGERLTIAADGARAPAFAGSLIAPRPLELVAPEKLELGPDGLTVRWRPDDAERIELGLVASRSDGAWVAIRCRARDAAGELTFPRALLARLPPPPRDLHLEVTRNQIARVATAQPGVGVILHASFARTLDAHQER